MENYNITNFKIIGIGIDSIEIDRFKSWQNFAKKRLFKIFSKKEIEYCLSSTKKSSERFAVRFAAKEASYKAFKTNMSFIKFCKYIEIKKEYNIPSLSINWTKLGINYKINTLISITHTNSIATAIVIFQQKN